MTGDREEYDATFIHDDELSCDDCFNECRCDESDERKSLAAQLITIAVLGEARRSLERWILFAEKFDLTWEIAFSGKREES